MNSLRTGHPPAGWVRALVLACVLAPATARSAGYSIYEQGAAALGMGGAYVAFPRDASAQFYNPAALPRLGGRQLLAGGTWLSTRTSFAGVDPYPGFGTVEEMKNGSFFPPQAYWTSTLGRHWAYGLGLNSPFGLGIEWKDPDHFSGREIVTKADLRTLHGSFDLAWVPLEHVSIAGGVDMLDAKVELDNVSTFVTSGGQAVNVTRAQLTSDYKPAYGSNWAVLADLWTNWRLGLVYRSEVKVQVDNGRATFTQIPTGDPALDAAVAAQMPRNQKVTTTLTFPASFVFGLGWTPEPEWTYEVDAVWTGWSAFQDLPLKFADPSLNRTFVENYQDQWQVRAGTEHRGTLWTWRAGYYYDQEAAPPQSVTPLLPDATRHGATLGLGTGRGRWRFDAYNLFLFVDKRSTEQRERDGYNGVYKTYVNALGASLAYRW